MKTISFLGSGNMAEALIKGVLTAKLFKPENIFISDIRPDRLRELSEKYSAVSVADNKELVSIADVLVLCVKPQKMTDALEGVKDSLKKSQLIISIAAGIKISKITDLLGDVAVVRVMPNTPALIGQSASALFANEKAAPLLDKAMKIFSAVGKAVCVDSEDLIDVVTAVSGSGPAYYFLLMEEMIKTAVKLGLTEEVAKDLVLQTAKGSALLADDSTDLPAELRRKVTSPGGTTEAALKVLTEGRFGKLIESAIKKAHQRSKELSR